MLEVDLITGQAQTTNTKRYLGKKVSGRAGALV